jgi:quinoprotein glucose dehydrogenase
MLAMKTLLLTILLLVAAVCTPLMADEFGSWDHYGGSQRGMQYSSIAQINKSNVAGLKELWRFRTGEMGERARHPFAFQANPIIVERRLYVSTGTAIVIAADPSTGAELWRYNPEIDRDRSYAEKANRGVSSWIDESAEPGAECRHTIFVGTLDARLIALDGVNGRRCSAFGNSGEIYLDQNVRAEDSEWANYTVTSPPVIVNGIVVVGSAIGDNRGVESELGIVRGIDARSGKERWRWDPIPRNESDPAYDSWKPEEAAKAGSANAWAPLAADPELGLVYVPTGTVSPDFYGGEREGDNLYANSLVALYAETGEIAWHQQLVHHDLWDYDLASQPTLVELEHGGEIIPAVLQGTKMGLVFSFDRRTGEPVFDIEERAVPQGGAPGEHLSPTQPFPVAPPSVSEHHRVTEEDAWGMFYFDKKDCREKIAGLRSDGIYTPPGTGGSISLPGFAGGINWGGLAFDPDNQVAVVFSLEIATEVTLVPRDDLGSVYESGEYEDQEFAQQSGTPYGMRRQTLMSFADMPCVAPPFGRMTAIDMRTGEFVWQTSFGTIQDVAPAIAPNLEIGMAGAGGPIVTAGGLVFIAASMDNYLRAFDLLTGEKLWEGRLPAGGQATPMTYIDEKTGKQVVVIAAGGHPNMGTTLGDYVVAFALPET